MVPKTALLATLVGGRLHFSAARFGCEQRVLAAVKVGMVAHYSGS